MHRLAAREHARARGPLLRNAHSQRMRALSAVHAPLIRTRARALHTSALYQKVSDLQTHSALCAPATVHTCTHLHTLSEGFCTHCLTCTHLHASAALCQKVSEPNPPQCTLCTVHTSLCTANRAALTQRVLSYVCRTRARALPRAPCTPLHV